MDDIEPPVCAVWPENWPPLQVFLAMATQWRVGLAGATGLDYRALPIVQAQVGVKRRQRREVFYALQILEREVLRLWGERRDE